MRNTLFAVAAVSAMTLMGSAAYSAEVTVTPSNMQGWYTPPGENNTGGASVINNLKPRSGDGSLQVSGGRVRFVLGDLYSPDSDLGDLGGFADLNFEYLIGPTSSNPYNPLYSPALRLTFWNEGVKDELVYEEAYQAPGGYGSAGAIGTWNSPTAPTFYLRSLGNENVQKTAAEWFAQVDSDNDAYASAVYIGVGSGASANYLAYVDNIRANGTTYNFEVAGVPEPAAWALMIMGFGGIGATLRRRRLVVAA
jgi:hypothetical protein